MKEGTSGGAALFDLNRRPFVGAIVHGGDGVCGRNADTYLIYTSEAMTTAVTSARNRS